MDSMPSANEIGTSPTSSAQPRLHAMRIGRRRRVSSHTPANRESTTTGAYRVALSTPTWNTVALSVRIATSGSENRVTWVPTSDTVSPAQSLTKSWFRRMESRRCPPEATATS